jgi:hypothetical protein
MSGSGRCFLHLTGGSHHRRDATKGIDSLTSVEGEEAQSSFGFSFSFVLKEHVAGKTSAMSLSDMFNDVHPASVTAPNQPQKFLVQSH